MTTSSFHLRYTDSDEAHRTGLSLRQQGLDQWHQRNDAAGSILYNQGTILLSLAAVLRERHQNSEIFKRLPVLEDSNAEGAPLVAAAHALSASCEGLVQSALKMLDAMRSSIEHAEALSQSADPLVRAGMDLHLSLSERSSRLIPHVLHPLSMLRAEAAQVIRRHAHAVKRG